MNLQLILMFVFCLHLVAAGQETLSSVQRELDRVDREIEREKKLHELEKKKVEDFEKKKGEKLQALSKQSGLLDSRLTELNNETSGLKQNINSLKAQIKNYDSRRAEMTKHLLEKIQELQIFFQADFPYQQKKNISDLDRLQSDLKEGVIGAEEGMNRLFTILRSAISVGYDSEVYSGTFQIGDGSEYEGKYLRLGAVIQVFVSLDGEKVAYLKHTDSSYVWVDEGLDLDMRQNIKKAVKVAEGKSAPELVLLPFGEIKFLETQDD